MLFAAIFIFKHQSCSQSVTDYDGNVYPAIAIGTQVWMQKNLKTTHYSNGQPIPTTLLPAQVDSTSKYQWTYNDDSNMVNIYGRLYSWFSLVCNNNVCPAGWHVPQDTEWLSLGNFLGGDSVAGGKMKEPGIQNWLFTDSTADNSSLFTALPSGFRGNPSGYGNKGLSGLFWSSTPWGSAAFQRAICYILHAGNSILEESVAVANCGLSVRCLRDAPLGTGELILEEGIQLFPNPANNILFLAFDKEETRTVNIYDLSGALVLQMTMKSKTETLDIHALSQGSYLIKIAGKDTFIQRKLIKNE
jgi:uncharacterized protein (TIGR02145 family)